MKRYPRVKFKISIKKDLETFYGFANDRDFDDVFGMDWAILKPYPYFKKYRTGDTLTISKQEVKNFINKKYNNKKTLIERNILIYEKQWRKSENEFFKLVDKLFPYHLWPKGKYVAYVTIWGMYPRFLADKTFQIPYKYFKSKYVNVIIAHEMLHFIFYDYFYKKFKIYNDKKYDLLAWHVSEIFNVIVQNSKEWFRVFGFKSFVYPEHRKIVKELSKTYHKKNNFNTDMLIKDIIKKVHNVSL